MILFIDKLNNINIYEQGYSCLDLIAYIKKSNDFSFEEKSNIELCFHKVKTKFKCERLLMLYMLDFIYLREDKSVELL